MEYNLLIATPAHNRWVHTDYMHSMLALQRMADQAGIGLDVATLGNQVTKKARNTLMSYFHQQGKYTHYLHVDADVGIQARDILKLLQRNVDLIGVPVPLGGYNDQGGPVLNIGEILSCTPDGLATTTHVGNAVLMFSRKAVNAIVRDSVPYSDDPRFSRGQQLTTKCYDIFLVGVLDGKYRPEDYSTCYRLRKLGFDVHLDLSIPVSHNKMHGYATTPEILGKMVEYFSKQEPAASACKWGGMSIQEEDWKFMEGIIKAVKPQSILEFGPGLSSVLMSKYAPVISYELDAERMDSIKQEVRVEVRKWNGKEIAPSHDKYMRDLAFVDGPKGIELGGPGRENSIRIAASCSDKVIIHDANREDEKRWQAEYLSKDFEVISEGGLCRYWLRKK